MVKENLKIFEIWKDFAFSFAIEYYLCWTFLLASTHLPILIYIITAILFIPLTFICAIGIIRKKQK